eukprot:TRINITY_DN1160_c0_g1_i3.p1 TRINITY_DN1160_c0_g1~~TRINITY_DN1160_c0_g1_i3.p1  ORF type:complete len:307 (-),score=24.07 TRINITY_DN1160_c0_g1_i3:26-946(-)
MRLSKIHIYQKDGHFDEHIDTIISKDHVGTCIIPIGINTYKGGEFLVSECQSLDDKSTLVYRVEANEIDKNKFEFNWITFYNDCLHKVNRVTDGTRIVLQYDVIWRGREEWIRIENIHSDGGCSFEDDPEFEKVDYDKKKQYLTFNSQSIIECLRKNDEILDKLAVELEQIMKLRKKNVGLFLNHLYKAHINKNHLKGVDLDIWDKLEEYFGEKRMKICSFLVTSSIVASDDREHEAVLKIEIMNPKTVNDSFDQSTKTHTLMYCGSKYSNLRSIYLKPLPSTGNSERYYDDVGCFSAIIISNHEA